MMVLLSAVNLILTEMRREIFCNDRSLRNYAEHGMCEILSYKPEQAASGKWKSLFIVKLF